MRKFAFLTILVLVSSALPNSAAAVDCDYHNLKLDYTTLADVDAIAPYDFCSAISKVFGTLNGSYITCAYEEDYYLSDDVYEDGVENVYTEKYFSWIETKNKGTVYFTEWSWSDDDFELDTVLLKVTGGTGHFEDAFGSLSSTPRFPNLGPVVRLKGYICTP